jgi:hypothetical protein
VIEAGDPVCTVRADGPDAATARHQALGRRQEILQWLDRFASPATGWNDPAVAQSTQMFPA